MPYLVLSLVAASGLFWLAYRRPRPRRWLLPRRLVPGVATAAVDRQHRHLRAGGMLGETACASTKAHFAELLDNGRADLIEREIRPGLDFAVQVRALTELGTPDAARVLEGLLTRALAHDPVEQAWYWVDVAGALRQLNRTDALLSVLRCTDAAADLPPGAVLAAEAVAFPNFGAALRQPTSAVGRTALRALVVTARAARDGVLDVGSVVRAGLGDALADLAARADAGADPWLALAVVEAERVFRRLGHWARVLPPEVRAVAEKQAMRLWAGSERRAAWLAAAPDQLRARFAAAPAGDQAAILRALAELRAEVAGLFPHLPDRRGPWWADAIRALRWSASPVVGPVLAGQAARFARKPRNHGRAAVVLAALRGHACYESELTLLRATSHPNPAVRRAAVGSLGWWPPYDPDLTVRALRVARTDPDPEARSAAVAALARLGERAALTEVAAGLHSEEVELRVGAAARIAAEELSWLWPDLESVAGSDDPDTALAASEALERMREGVVGFAQ